jgi:3-methyladenine DNA glycosylase AlkD
MRWRQRCASAIRDEGVVALSLVVAEEVAHLSSRLRDLAPLPVDPFPIIKTALPFYGVSLDELRALARSWIREHKDVDGSQVLAVADALWQQAVREEMVVAAMLVGGHGEALDSFGWRRLDRWGRLLDNWETTDNLGGRVLGPWVAARAESRMVGLERRVGRRNPWMRRIVLVACVHVVRHREAQLFWPRVAGLVLALAADREASIPKAISWVLRESIHNCAEQVECLLDERASDLPAIAVRETRNKLQTGYKSGRR